MAASNAIVTAPVDSSAKWPAARISLWPLLSPHGGTTWRTDCQHRPGPQASGPILARLIKGMQYVENGLANYEAASSKPSNAPSPSPYCRINNGS
ncbi:protein of unknown function (plasmid) [Cupriavidus taiwanensis]|uniref:Uncharacterized protein n=1 Tax=Cupriavidus taiwanensis TaxID=164546 RepID=A0A375ISS4_9BURK|nr:protein of unknown function [Cupriavidus taiwanensis]